MGTDMTGIAQSFENAEGDLLDRWVDVQLRAASMRRDLLDEEELRHQSRRFLGGFVKALSGDGGGDVEDPAWDDVRATLDEVTRTRTRQGFSPSETASFIFSLKEPLFEHLQEEGRADGPSFWRVSQVLDHLGLYTTELHQRAREEVIRRQEQDLLELSTPVVKLWEGIVAVPLIGTLDSERTQVVMENLLEAIVDTGSTVAIVDITGVPTVDTLVAQHLIKTVAAARLMGAECIISGIRPQIAQTMVHLGIELEDVQTKASLADAISLALDRLGLHVNRGS
jgi:rsbT co-antagonist protein RsbR